MAQKTPEQEIKETVKKAAHPIVESGKGYLGRTLHRKAFKQSGIKGSIAQGLASLLREKEWYK